ncbi:hypothetical protein EDB83DRAFT_2356106 [Lactarius deliciosus]|nr:hypothetical protein EDB83DRAFT_2356106 [Lactarius deliciosus]
MSRGYNAVAFTCRSIALALAFTSIRNPKHCALVVYTQKQRGAYLEASVLYDLRCLPRTPDNRKENLFDVL